MWNISTLFKNVPHYAYHAYNQNFIAPIELIVTMRKIRGDSMPCHLPQAFIYDIQITGYYAHEWLDFWKETLYSTVLTTLNSTLIQRSQVSDLVSIFLKEIESTYNIQIGRLKRIAISGFSYRASSFFTVLATCAGKLRLPHL